MIAVVKRVQPMIRIFSCFALCVVLVLAGCAKNAPNNSGKVSNNAANTVAPSDTNEPPVSKAQAKEIAMTAVQTHNDEIGREISGVYEAQNPELIEENTILLPNLMEKNKTILWIVQVKTKAGITPPPNTELEHYHDYGVFISAETGEVLDLIWCS